MRENRYEGNPYLPGTYLAAWWDVGRALEELRNVIKKQVPWRRKRDRKRAA